MYENQTPTESLDVTSISSDVEIKEEFIENLEENEPKNFSAINRLNLHTDKDQEAITYKCSKCGKTFFQSIELRKHTESFHEEIRYNCENCEKIFTQKGHLNAHIKTCGIACLSKIRCKDTLTQFMRESRGNKKCIAYKVSS